MIWVFGMGYFTSVGITFLTLHKLWRLVSGRITDDELVMVSESEEPVAHAQPASPAQGGRA
jgi:TRAP-type C4-dicarboxylate transport system permease small subunit